MVPEGSHLAAIPVSLSGSHQFVQLAGQITQDVRTRYPSNQPQYLSYSLVALVSLPTELGNKMAPTQIVLCGFAYQFDPEARQSA